MARTPAAPVMGSTTEYVFDPATGGFVGSPIVTPPPSMATGTGTSSGGETTVPAPTPSTGAADARIPGAVYYSPSTAPIVSPGGPGSKAGTLSEQYVREAPEIEARRIGLLDSALALSQTPLNLPQYQVAGFSPEQQRSFEMGMAGIGAYQPMLGSAATSMDTATAATNEAADIVRGADTRAQFDPAQRAMALGAEYSMAGAAGPTMGDIQGYMNPYQQLVTQNAMAEFQRQADIQQKSLNAQAARSGAFGGVREGVQRAELGRNLADIQSRRLFEDYAQNYAQAQNLFANEANRRLTAGGQLGNIGQGIGGLATAQYNIGQSMASTLGGLGTQLSNIGVQQAGLAELGQTLGQRDVGMAFNIGEAQRQQRQQGLDAERQSRMQQIYEPYQRVGFVSDIYKGAPTTQMTTALQVSPQPSTAQQAAGLGIGALATAGAAERSGLKLF